MTNINKEVKSWWKDYKVIRFKSRADCTVEELKKKLETNKNLIYSFAIMTALLLAVIMDLWIDGQKVSIMLNTLLIMCVLALWNEMTERNNLQLFMYFKERENIP